MSPFRTVLGDAELDFNYHCNHRGCRALIVSVVKCSILFYKCLPAVHALHIRGEGGFHTSEGKPKHPLLFLWCTKSGVRLWILFLPKNWMVTLSICSIHHVQERVWATLPFPLFRFLSRSLPCSASHSFPHFMLCFSNVGAAEDKSKALFY